MYAPELLFKLGLYAVVFGLLLSELGLSAFEVSAPVLNVTQKAIDVPLNTQLYLKCTGSSEVVWQYENPMTEEKMNLDSLTESLPESTENGTLFESVIGLDFKTYEDTGRYICAYSNLTLSKSSSLYVFVNDFDNLLLPSGDGMLSEIFQVHEGEPFRFPCLVSISLANVTLWKGICGEELVPPDATSYDPERGFLVLHPTKYFQPRFCCKAQLNGYETSFDFYIFFTAQTQVIPQVHMDISEAEYVVVKSSFNLTCIVLVEEGTMFNIRWGYPSTVDGARVDIIKQVRDPNLDRSLMQAYREKFIVTDVQKSDEGIYQCNVTDHSHKENYIEQFVRVHERRQPSVVTFNSTIYKNSVFPLSKKTGERMKFEVYYSVFPPSDKVNIYWKKNGVPISIKPGKYETSQTPETVTLIIRKLKRNDSGTYTVVGATPETTRSFSLEFKVKDVPQISILTPEQCCYMAGEIYQLSCIASGFPRPNSTWLWKRHCEVECDTTEVMSNSSVNFVNITEEIWNENDTSVLNLLLTAMESGEYICKSTNEMGTTEENISFIITDVKDGFDITSETLNPIESAAFSVTCSANKLLYEDVEIRWVPPFQTLPVEPTGADLSSSDSSFSIAKHLSCGSIGVNHSGSYECHATYRNHSFGMNKKSISVGVRALEEPRVEETNLNSTKIVGSPDEELELFCYVSGVPKPVVTWYRNDQPLNANGSARRFTDDFQKLVIPRLVPDDGGWYECKAENKVGVVVRSTILDVTAVSAAASSSQVMDSKQRAMLAVLGVGGLSTLVLLFLIGRKIHRQKRRRKQLLKFNHKVFQEGQVSLFNPDLPLDDQAELLPYDARWEFPKERLKFGRTLGQGAFGRVVKAEAIGLIDCETSTAVAVKMLKERADINQQKALMAELKILIHLGHHVNIVNLLGAVTKNIPKGELMVIVEYCRYGNLRHYLLRYRDKFIVQEEDLCTQRIEHARRYLRTPSHSRSHYSNSDEDTAPALSPIPRSPGSSVENRSYEFFKSFGNSGDNTVGSGLSDTSRVYYRVDSKEHCITTIDLICFAFQCARAMDYLASRKLIHRDLAARNVLLGDDNIVKICDFGLAKDCYKYSNYVKKGDGPLPVKWMAIESIGDKVFTTKSDVWSFGVLLWEFFTLGGNPYPGIQVDEDFYRRLKQGYRMEKPQFAPDVIYQIMKDCWKSDPAQRPDFFQLSNALGELLESGTKQHYIDLNEPYLVMNQQIALNHSYLNVTRAGEQPSTADYMNAQVPGTVDGYDEVPPVRYSAEEATPKSPMEVVPMIHFGCEVETSKPHEPEIAKTSDARCSSTDYLCMGNRPLNGTEDSVFISREGAEG